MQFKVTYNTGIGQPYQTVIVTAFNAVSAQLAAENLLGNIRIVSVQGPV